MNQDYRYSLDNPKVTGRRQQKTTCPQCGRKNCFVRYVDTKNDCRYVDNSVGRCDHEQSCGYHYKPSEYFRDNPWLSNNDSWRQPQPRNWQPPQPKIIFQPLAPEYVWMQHSPQSTFWHWMTTCCKEKLALPDEVLRRTYDDYMLGATRQSDVIFWQIDHEQRVHTGHIMQYGPDGHRLGFNYWEHKRLMREGRLPQDYVVYQCLFGQHLLPRYPHKAVCLVESEKTALIMACTQPAHLWLATCGCGGLAPEKVECLKGRHVTLFPDSGSYSRWAEKMKQAHDIDYRISCQLEAYPPNTDLADILLDDS